MITKSRSFHPASRTYTGRWLGIVLWSLVLLYAIGCSSQIKPDSITQFGLGVTKVRDGVKSAVLDANTLARDQEKAWILANPEKGLTEDLFVLAVKPSDAAQWDNAFSGMQTYVVGLQSLLSTSRSEQFSDQTQVLGKELSEGYAKTDVPPGVATAFTEIGKVLIETRQNRDAMDTMRKADPGVRAALSSMAKAIGNDPRGKDKASDAELMGTVYSNWKTAMGHVSQRFVKMRDNHDTEGLKTALNEFLDLMDRRDSQLDALSSLRQSILALADAHTAAARGANSDVAGIMAMISQKIDGIQTTYRKFSALTKEAK